MMCGGTWAVAARIVRQLLRYRRALALVIVAPALVMTLFAVILDTEEPRPRIALKASGLIAIFLDSFAEIWPDLAILALFALGAMILASVSVRRTL